jgi:hypothetical protein
MKKAGSIEWLSDPQQFESVIVFTTKPHHCEATVIILQSSGYSKDPPQGSLYLYCSVVLYLPVSPRV